MDVTGCVKSIHLQGRRDKLKPIRFTAADKSSSRLASLRVEAIYLYQQFS